jgi:integrase
MAKKKRLTDANVAALRPTAKKYEIWDELPNLCVRVEVSGRKTFYYVYSIKGRMRWYKIGDATLVDVKLARLKVKELYWHVVNGRDPQSERVALRQSSGGVTFAQLHTRYLEEWAKKRNKSWAQANSLMIKQVPPRWGKFNAAEITRAQVKALFGRLSVDSPGLANQVLWAIGPVFTFAVNEEVVTTNPCKGITANPTNSRDRVLSDTEMAAFWNGCEQVDPVKAAALRVILLTGQRPGEVSRMRREHIRDGWWEMPGKPVPALGWPGTKNASSNRVWLSSLARDLIAEVGDGDSGFVFASDRGNAVGELDEPMRAISAEMRLEPPVTPHDLRRTAGSTITGRGHGREAMDRILNHKKKSVTDVYDRHDYAAKDKLIMEDLSAAVMAAVDGRSGGNVVEIAPRAIGLAK